MMEKVAFLTGGTGFIGTHLAFELLRRNFHLYLLIRNEEKARSRFSNIEKGEKITFLKGTIFDIEEYSREIEKSSYFFHLAALTKALRKEEFFEVNVKGTQKVLEVLKNIETKNLRFIHISSLAALGPSKTYGHPEFKGPVSTYGMSKLESEKVVKDHLPTKMYTIIRPPAVFGPFDTDVYKFFKSVKNGIVPLIGFKEKLVSIVYVKDLVRGIVDSAISENTGGKEYCLAYEKFFTWKELGKIASSILNKRVLYLRIPHLMVLTSGALNGFFTRLSGKADIFDLEKAKEITKNYWICDVKNAKKDFNFSCRYSIEKAFEETIKWYQNENLL